MPTPKKPTTLKTPQVPPPRKADENINHPEYGETIKQIVPCTSEYYNVFENEDGTYFYERVDYIALRKNGLVSSLTHTDGSLNCADEHENFIGYFPKDELCEYPETKNV